MSYNALIAWLISDQGAHCVIMPMSSARFTWYAAFDDQPLARPFEWNTKEGAMGFMRNVNPLSMGSFAIRKTIKFKSNVGRGRGWGGGGGGGGICLSVS
jgi:hypothetical protein